MVPEMTEAGASEVMKVIVSDAALTLVWRSIAEIFQKYVVDGARPVGA